MDGRTQLVLNIKKRLLGGGLLPELITRLKETWIGN